MSETKITKIVVQKEGRKLIFNPAGDIDLSQYYTKSEIDSKFNSYALKTEIPDTSDLATKTELNSVKSTATTANSTANSAKTTAQNALNTANSKSNAFTCSNQGCNPGRVYSFKMPKRAFITNVIGGFKIDGYTPKYLSFYAGESSSSYVYTVNANCTITSSSWLSNGNYDIGFYLI